MLKRVTGSHHHYQHPIKSGIVTVPHPKKDIPLGTLKERGEASPAEIEVTPMRHYIALIHKDPKSDFGVSFPDFPGCVTAGSTLEEAASMAAEALAGHVALMVEEGLEVPEPTPLDAIRKNRENRSGVPVLVPEPRTKIGKAMRVNITMPSDVLESIDQFADAHGFNRSGFLVHAAKKVMETEST
jgi:predicted RNase H-like HicB family nuclease